MKESYKRMKLKLLHKWRLQTQQPTDINKISNQTGKLRISALSWETERDTAQAKQWVSTKMLSVCHLCLWNNRIFLNNLLLSMLAQSVSTDTFASQSDEKIRGQLCAASFLPIPLHRFENYRLSEPSHWILPWINILKTKLAVFRKDMMANDSSIKISGLIKSKVINKCNYNIFKCNSDWILSNIVRSGSG